LKAAFEAAFLFFWQGFLLHQEKHMSAKPQSRLLLLLLLLAALSTHAKAAAWVTMAGELRAVLHKPAGKGPFPAVVTLHGCAGMGGARLNARDQDWARRLVGAGFVVIQPDSFGSRGLGSQCSTRERAVNSAMRADDAFAAAKWLVDQGLAQPDRIGVLGWSNGGTTALHVARAGSGHGVRVKQVVAFYPGCRTFADHGFAVPLTILHGLEDNWTPAEPCQKFVSARFIGYANAHHDFDHPSMPLRQREAAFSAGGGPGTVTMGTHGPSRAKAIATVMGIFRGM
jgi:dienelactone hydrolase